MELFEVLNNYCNRNSGAVDKSDKIKYSFILKRLFSAQYPIQCELINKLDSDALCASNIVALLASRYTGLPAFLKVKVDQKKKKEKNRKNYDDCVLDKYMEINECGIRELEEAYEVDKKSIDEVLKLIKQSNVCCPHCGLVLHNPIVRSSMPLFWLTEKIKRENN